MDHADTYRGQPFVIRTVQNDDGWASSVTTTLDGCEVTLVSDAGVYPDQDSAIDAARSAAAAALDRRRAGTGKP